MSVSDVIHFINSVSIWVHMLSFVSSNVPVCLIQILWNPFDDMVPRQVRKEPSPTQKIETQDQKKKTVK